MEAALDARAMLTDEETEDLHSADLSMDSELKHVDTGGEDDTADEDDDDDAALTEEDDDGRQSVGTKSPLKAKKKAAARDEDDDEDEDVDVDTADEDDVELDTADEEDDEDEEDEDDEEARTGDDEPNAAKESNVVDLSDPKSMRRMVQSLPEREARRHEHFRRAHFDRAAIKRIMARTLQANATADKRVPTVAQVMVIVMAGMTKSFVGALTAEARRIMDRNGETGPIEPRHLREAQRKYYKRRPLARGRARQRLLR